jgi:hypothetical protein
MSSGAATISSMMLLTALSACGPGAGDPCNIAKTKECGDKLICADPTRSGARCLTSEEATKRCSAADECHKYGWCTFQSANPLLGCRPGTADDCRNADACKAHGACSLVDIECVVATEADCKQSTDCTTRGRCTLQVGGGENKCVEK